MVKRLLVAPLLFVSVAARAVPNGLVTEAPQVVHMWLNHGQRDCSGTLIAPTTILTAAHCLVDLDPLRPSIQVIASDPPAYTGLFLQAKRFVINPAYRQVYTPKIRSEHNRILEFIDYVETKNVDVGLIQLEGPATGILKSMPLRIDRTPDAWIGTDVEIIGRANDQPNSSWDLVHVARKGNNRILASWGGILFTVGMSEERINKTLEKGAAPTGEAVGIGGGDSGSPMIAGGAVIGVNVGAFVKKEDRDLLRRIIPQPGEVLSRNTTDDQSQWSFTAALSDPKNVAFLRSAREQGYDIPSLDGGTPAAAPAAVPEPTALEQLLRAGKAGEPFQVR